MPESTADDRLPIAFTLGDDHRTQRGVLLMNAPQLACCSVRLSVAKESEGMRNPRVTVCLYLNCCATYRSAALSVRHDTCHARGCLFPIVDWLRLEAPRRTHRRHSFLVNHHDYAIFSWRNPHGKALLCPDDRINCLRSDATDPRLLNSGSSL